MKKLLMTMVLVVCAVGGSAQGLRPRRTLGSRLQRPVASAPKEQKTCVRTTTANGVEWTYEVVGDGVFLGSSDKGALSVRPDKKAKLAVPQNTSGTIVIPETFAGIPVRGIGAGAFSCCSNLTLVTIPSSVTSIGSDAFRDCRGLMSVTIPSSVTGVGDRAFEGCSGLMSVAVPSSKTHIGHDAFRGCGSIKNAVIPGWVGAIDLSQVTNLVVAEGTTHIAGWGTPGCGVFPFGSLGFKGNLVSVTIPASVTRIERNAFSTCRDLMSFSVDASNPSYSSRNGMLCSKDGGTLIVGVNGDVTIPASMTNIGWRAFCGCRGLKSFSVDASNPSCSSRNGMLCTKDGNTLIVGVNGDVTIPTSVTSIGGRAFSYCSGLTSVRIHESVTNINSGAFSDAFIDDGSSAMKSFSVDASNPSYSSRNGLLCSKDGKTLISGVNGDVTIPEGVTNIGDGAFCCCVGLKSVIIPSSVMSIGNWAFKGCCGLTDVTIPSSVTSIGGWAFAGCNGLTSMAIPSSVTDVGHWAFSSCSNLTLLTISSGVTNIGDRAFSGCNGLTSVTIPSGVTSIGSGTFEDCSGLTSVTIPEGVTSIGNGAFRNCRELTSVTIPSSVTSIGVGAFRGCSRLSSVTIPEGVMSIENGAFSDCVGLTAVTIPASMTNIADFAFSGCTELALVKVQPHVANIGRNAFRDCSGLTTVIIPSNLTNIVTTVTKPNSTMSVRGHGRFKSRAASMKLEDAVKAVFGRAGTFLPPTNGMTTVVFEKSTAVKRNAGVRGGRPFGSGSLRGRRLQRQQKEQTAAKSECAATCATNKPALEKVSVAEKLGQCDFLLNKDFKKSAKFYLCLFSASWCPPCRREMPRIAKAYAETLKDDPDIELIHFSCDQNDEKAMAWAKEHDVKFPVVKPNGGNPLNLQTNGIPHLFIVKADGTLVEEGHPMRIFNEEKFKELKSKK